MIISRTTGSRSSAMNMCSVRQRPIPSRAEVARLGGIVGRVGVGAHLQPAQLVGPAEDRLEVLVDLRRDERHLADDHPAGAAVDRDRVALGELLAADASACAPRGRSSGPRSRRRTACPSRARRRPRARSCRRARSGSRSPGSGRGCRRASSPSGRGSRSRPPSPRSSAVSASSTIAPQAAPGEAFRPCAATSSSRGRVDHRVQQLVELAPGRSARPPPRARSGPPPTIETAAFSAAAAVRLAERVCSR